jgi:anti-anti-sigma factor
MPSSLMAISLDGEAEDAEVSGSAIVPCGIAEGERAGAALAMQQFGLMAAPRGASDDDRRIEDWIASQLDLALEVEPSRGRRNIWDRLIDSLPAARRSPKRRTLRGGPETGFAEWSRFRVAYRRGITVVRLVDVALAKERNVRELTRDLIELIEAGNHRLILNFQGVERVASWVALAIDEAYRRARSSDGGELKVCGMSGPLAAVLDLAGMAPGIELHPDETSALDAPWPQPSTPRTLPVDILMALTTGPELPPIRGGAPAQPAVAGTAAVSGKAGRVRLERTSSPAGGEPGLWLIVRMGSNKGRTVPVVGPRFVIGRQRDCQLRLGSPMVSKFHAAIERRDGRIVLADLGSTNGTVLNGRLLRGNEADVHDGDRIQVGPVVCTLATVAHRQGSGKVEERVAEWLHGEDAAAHAEQINALDTAVVPISGPAPTDGEHEWAFRTEVIQDVLVVTPEVGELENDATIEQLRVHLHSLLGQQVPRRVVVNLEYVAHLTGQAIGVLLAHHLRLDRSGGALRICQARARIMAVLHQVRLTILVECHPTLDEAVLSAWPDARRRVPAGD